MDLVVRAQRIPVPGETVLGGGYRTFPGGKGANQAVAAARMGARVWFLGSVGDDQHGVRLREALSAEAIDLAGLTTRPGEATGLALITVTDGGENTIVVAPGANASVSPVEVQASAGVIEGADVLLLQLEIPTPTVEAAARIARKAGRCVILNAAPARVLPRELLSMVDVLIVNQTEAMRLLNIEAKIDPARLTLRLPELGPQTAILTLGASGAIMAHKGRPRRVNSPNVKSVDSVGAGDAFCGALASAWGAVYEASKRRDAKEFEFVDEAVRCAAAAGALATTKLGALPSMPTRAEVEGVLGLVRAS
jgi:ribokinase